MAQLSPITSAIIVLLSIALAGIASAYSTPELPHPTTPTSSRRPSAIGRGAFLSSASAACLTSLLSRPAFAKEVDPAVKGTKADPEFQACLSQCMYECTKPKGVEQRSRAECLPECKSKCATTKEQLMKGAPIKKE